MEPPIYNFVGKEKEKEEEEEKTRRQRRKSCDVAAVLRKSWYRLRLSARDPCRAPTWDAVVLTAASPEQAELYRWQLGRAKRLGRIAPSTVTLAVPDPDGARIGSGAATLHALHSLASHLARLQASNYLEGDSSSSVNGWSGGDITPMSVVDLLAERHVLLLHAGGDSKRVPWANPMGKVFLPLPYLASDDPDVPVPLLFDHILAISSCARRAFDEKGGIFIMTGDVLPCFDATSVILPDDAACIITVPITLDIASNHGVVVASRTAHIDEVSSVSIVENLLQKPTFKELLESNAVGQDGRALLDTGIIAVRGKAWTKLLMLTSLSRPMISELLKARKEMSLYEDLVAAWVPAKHDWLRSKPFGKELVNELGGQRIFSYRADDMMFLHFGTSTEVLDHLGDTDSGLVGRRHLCCVPETTACDVAASAIILSSKISPGVSIGENSLVYDSSLSGRIQIGFYSIVVGVNIQETFDQQLTAQAPLFVLPDRHCLWEVPLVGSTERILIYCGLHDNPKDPFSGGGTFCGRPWKKVINDLGLKEEEIWANLSPLKMCLWNAKIFPVLTHFDMLKLSMWLMGSSKDNSQSMLSSWRSCTRVSLEELHRSIDFPQMCYSSSNHLAKLASGFAKACINYGLLGRNLSQLCEEILQDDAEGTRACKELFLLCSNLQSHILKAIPQSRVYQVQVDLLRALGDEVAACFAEEKLWAAVVDETALAIKFGFEDHCLDSSRQRSITVSKTVGRNDCKFQSRTVKIELPVRVDFVGGWSDTPPWSLERPGCVLNMAICLDKSLPVGTLIETVETSGILISDDSENHLYIPEPTSIAQPFHEGDPFRLVKSALLVTGICHDNCLSECGITIKTWAHVPRGSGLGTSSILAAAVVKGLLHLMGQDDSNENVARIVLVLEQIMGTGGGWQDQIGGLYPGIKCTCSFPGQPLLLQVVPLLASPWLIQRLEERLLVVFTGQVRLAHRVLQKVVVRYLRRDSLLISSIKRLAALAKIGREALMNGDLDELGEVMLEAWRLHQELDPYCSNEFVDRLFAFAERLCCGYKMVGAGGGGFALLLARDCNSALKLRQLLEEHPDFPVKVYNWSFCSDSPSNSELHSFMNQTKSMA